MTIFGLCHSCIQWTICNQLLKMLSAFYETRKPIIVSNTAPRLPMSTVKFSPRRLQHMQPENAPCHYGASTTTICSYKHHDYIWADGSTAPFILNCWTSWRWSAVRPCRLTRRKWATSTEGFLGPRTGLDALEERKISYSCRESSYN